MEESNMQAMIMSCENKPCMLFLYTGPYSWIASFNHFNFKDFEISPANSMQINKYKYLTLIALLSHQTT